MAAENPDAPREAVEHQDQSIKVRKSQLFEEPKHEAGSTRPFSAYLKETPPAPLPAGVKAALGATAAVVVLLLLGALLFGHPRPAAGPKRADRRDAGGNNPRASAGDPADHGSSARALRVEL